MNPDASPVCALCLEARPLVRSHIFPRHAARELVEEEGETLVQLTSHPTQRNRYTQSGHSEPLLCEECDSKRLGRLDDYAARLFRGGRDSKFFQSLRPSTPPAKHLETTVKYDRFKLFALSLLWRFSVSTLCKGTIRLGPNGEVMRRMLLSGEPGPAHVFPMGFILLPPIGEIDPRSIMGMPHGGRTKSMLHLYFYHLFGLHWVIFATRSRETFPFSSAGLAEDGRLVVLQDVRGTFGKMMMDGMLKLALNHEAKHAKRP